MLENLTRENTVIIMNWKDVVKDADEIKVFAALDGPNVTWRTASAVSRQTGITEDRVWKIVAKYNSQLTRLGETPSITGSAFIGLVENVG